MNYYLTHGTTKPLCRDWFDAGITHLKTGGDANSWHILMFGA